jgi:hypothetical protein
MQVARLGIQNTQFCGDYSNEEQNHEVYNRTSISYLTHFGPLAWLLRLAVKSMSLAGRAVLRTSRIRALRTGVSSPLIRSLLKTSRLAQKASRVDSSRGAEI